MSAVIKDKNWCLPAQVFFTVWSQHSALTGSGCTMDSEQAGVLVWIEMRIGGIRVTLN